MNLMRHRSVKFIGATLICMAGLFTASYAFAGKSGGTHHHNDNEEVRIKDLECWLEGSVKNKDLTLKVKGVAKGETNKPVEVQVKVKGFVKTVCETPSGNIVQGQPMDHEKKWFDAHESEWLGKLDGYEKFKLSVDVSEELHHKGKAHCQGQGLTAKRKVVITDVIVKIVSKTGDVLATKHCEPDESGSCSAP